MFTFPPRGVTCHRPKITLPFKAAGWYLSSYFKEMQPPAVTSPCTQTAHASSSLFACSPILSLKHSPAPLVLPPPGTTWTSRDSFEILYREATWHKYYLVLFFSSQLLVEQAFSREINLDFQTIL